VIHGLDTLDALEGSAVDSKFRPLQPVKLEKVIIHANPLAANDAY